MSKPYFKIHNLLNVTCHNVNNALQVSFLPQAPDFCWTVFLLITTDENTVFKYCNTRFNTRFGLNWVYIGMLSVKILTLTLTANFVQFLFPMWPAILFPGQILPGSWKKTLHLILNWVAILKESTSGLSKKVQLLRTLPPGIFIENKRKIKPKELPKHLIPCLLVNKLHISAGQFEILVTVLSFYFPVPFIPLLPWNSFKVNHGGTNHLCQRLPCTILLPKYMMCCTLYNLITKVATKRPFE